MPGDPIVVQYAPQLELIQKATLVITHAGLNTTLESLANGVPMVAIPVTNDQPGVAARIEWHGVGMRIPISKLSVAKLNRAVREVMDNPDYRSRAKKLQTDIAADDGLETAANIVESVFQLGTKVRMQKR
jgi:zeaxanthin glucosyltransferase